MDLISRVLISTSYGIRVLPFFVINLDYDGTFGGPEIQYAAPLLDRGLQTL